MFTVVACLLAVVIGSISLPLGIAFLIVAAVVDICGDKDCP